MKRFVIISASALLCLCSCTQKLVLPEDPTVKDQGRTEITASLDGDFVWTASSKVGVYDSEGGSNIRYTIMPEYVGKSGQAKLFGRGISGKITAYYPYSESGFPEVADFQQPIRANQKWCPSADQHIKENLIMVAGEDEDGVIRFSYSNGTAGLMHLKLAFEVEGNVREVVINYPGSQTIKVTGLNSTCSAAKPLDVWAIVPVGTISNLTVSAHTATKWVSSPASAAIVVTPGKTTDCTISEKSFDSGNQDFKIIDANFE